MDAKSQVKLNIQSKLIYDYLFNNHDLISSDAWNSKTDILRFSTINLDSLFTPRKERNGHWKNGRKAFYEIINGLDSLIIRCSIDYKNLTNIESNILVDFDDKLQVYYEDDLCIIKKWSIIVDDINNNLNIFINKTLKDFESIIFNDINNHNNCDEEMYLSEGDIIRLATLKYERNPNARQKCLDYYGYTCKICGFDFEKRYGKDFKKIIEVHHIKPLSEIKENYIVNPIEDLIPVCSNCHTALHSKKNGVYTPNELINIIK